MEGSGTLTTSSTAASPTPRCYFLELPAELRTIIYDHYFKSSLDIIALLEPGRAQMVARALVKDSKRFHKKSSFLRTSRTLMHDAFPIYQKTMEGQLELLECVVDAAEQAMRESGTIHLLFDIHIGSIARLCNAKHLVEGLLVAWAKLEKSMVKGVGEEEEGWGESQAE